MDEIGDNISVRIRERVWIKAQQRVRNRVQDNQIKNIEIHIKARVWRRMWLLVCCPVLAHLKTRDEELLHEK